MLILVKGVGLLCKYACKYACIHIHTYKDIITRLLNIRVQSASETEKDKRRGNQLSRISIYLGCLRDFLKEAMVAVPLVMTGSLFQRRGAEDAKALSPVRVRIFGKGE